MPELYFFGGHSTEFFTETGYTHPTLKQLADAQGTSMAGILVN
ncbi:hypothetical protein [Pedobacter ginsengisoli]|nr:hypothetical protein [Pedobacter ginsengisoli]